MRPLVSVVIPAYERRWETLRALRSVQRQTVEDFECIVVDDASTEDIVGTVSRLADPRFRAIRREANGGPYAARFTAFREIDSPAALFLDSDHELYPWSLERGLHYLRHNAAVDIVCGLHVRTSDSRLFVRVADGPLLITPADARLQSPIPDRPSMFRIAVVHEWSRKSPDYFALEAHLILTAALSHSQLYVDEPWTMYHVDLGDRVTLASPSQRRVDDFARFLRDHADLFSDPQPNLPLDAILRRAYFQLLRARAPEAEVAAHALQQRGISRGAAIAAVVRDRVRARLPSHNRNVTWI